MTYATGELGRREAAAVISAVGSLKATGHIHNGEITSWHFVVRHLVTALEGQGLTLSGGGLDRMIANIYAEVADAHARRLTRDHLADAIAQDN